MSPRRRRFSAAAATALALACASLSAPGAAAGQEQKTFATPDEAVAALRAASESGDKAALRDIFGPQLRDLLTGDEAQDKANSRNFAKSLEEGVRPVPEKNGSVVLEIGRNKWPFPIPLVKSGSAWRFDTVAGKDEVINRHIGKDELHAIGLCRAYVNARNESGAVALPNPAHGYRFKALPRQRGSRLGGFALAAYPENWGRSGVMTFIVSQDGKIYQRDLGKRTAQVVARLDEYDPDGDWIPTEDRGVGE